MKIITTIAAIALVIGSVIAVSAATKITFTTPESQANIVEGDMIDFMIRDDGNNKAIYSRIAITDANGKVTEKKPCNFFPGDGYYADIINSTIGAGAVGEKYTDKIEQGIIAKCKDKFGWSGDITSD